MAKAKEVNTHDLKMVGLAEAAKDTVGLNSYCMPAWVEIFYDLDDGEVWTRFHCGLDDSRTVYHSPSIIKVGGARRRLTKQRIADMVADAVAEKRYNDEHLKWVDGMGWIWE